MRVVAVCLFVTSVALTGAIIEPVFKDNICVTDEFCKSTFDDTCLCLQPDPHRLATCICNIDPRFPFSPGCSNDEECQNQEAGYQHCYCAKDEFKLGHSECKCINLLG